MAQFRLFGLLCVACVSYSSEPGLASIDAGEFDARTILKPDAMRTEAGRGPAGATCGGSKQCPARMVCVPHPIRAFCIDSWEASVAEYQAATSMLSTTGQDARCTWNDSYTPAFVLGTNPELPVVGVDFCDALAYCKSRGKRLCQKVGGGGDGSASEGEWYNACSETGAKLFPYGGNVSQPLCVIGLGPNANGSVRRTGGPSSCEGGVQGLYEMVGNVHEWVDRTLAVGGTPRDDSASFAGGAWGQGSGDTCLTLASAFGAARALRGNDVGIRCCADPL
jgi:formylglycine-generating enzyme